MRQIKKRTIVSNTRGILTRRRIKKKRSSISQSALAATAQTKTIRKLGTGAGRGANKKRPAKGKLRSWSRGDSDAGASTKTCGD